MSWTKFYQDIYGKVKRPRVCFKTLQLAKQQGGWSLPLLRYYYFAALMRAVICWCNPSYTAQWKNIEEKTLPIPVQATLADNNLQTYINNIDNPWVKWTLKI